MTKPSTAPRLFRDSRGLILVFDNGLELRFEFTEGGMAKALGYAQRRPDGPVAKPLGTTNLPRPGRKAKPKVLRPKVQATPMAPDLAAAIDDLIARKHATKH